MTTPTRNDPLHAQLAEASGAALPALILDARRAASAIIIGSHGKRRAGSGDGFWQHREWSNGESVRQIDWRRSARSDKLFVREREWQVPAHLQIWCDHRPSMNWSSRPDLPTKAERAMVIALAMALATRAGGERVSAMSQSQIGGVAFSDELSFARNLLVWGGSPPSGARLGQVLIISDGLESAAIWDERARAIIAARADLLVVLVGDPAEYDFPFQGRVEFQAHNDKEPITIGKAQSARVRYQDEYQRHFAAVTAAINQAGGHVVRHATDGPLAPLLISLVAQMSGAAASNQGLRA
jgi:uncharacterized protein (DUF58 family)